MPVESFAGHAAKAPGRQPRSRRGATALLVLAAIGLSLSVAAFITNSGVSTLASAALPGNSDRANFADRFFLSARMAEGAALQPFKRYMTARAEPETTAREALASRWMPADFRASFSDDDGTQIALPKIAAPASAPSATPTTTTTGIPLPRSRPTAADQTAQVTSQALALAAAPANRPAERSLLQKLSDIVTPNRMTMASLSTGPNLFGKGPDLSLFGYDGATAVYDIKARAVYLPDGTVFEAHSGMGTLRDDPDHVDVRMQGATPPAVYSLKPRERDFHGVAALRMAVADGSDINGRSGLLVHSFMLGPSGDSNGCISVKDYDRFLKAFNDGQFTHIAVVPSLKSVAETLAAQADPG
jgi:Tlde1 domain